jgi:signal transduction histidine kinase/CheY-like chemotaxis protein
LPLAGLQDVDPKMAAAATQVLLGAPVEVGRGIVGGVVESGRAARLFGGDVARMARSDYRAYLEKRPVAALVVAPLRAAREIVGALTVSRRHPAPPFTADDEHFLQELADRAALSIENAILYERAQRERERAEGERLRAEAANRARDEFLAMLGHELRNPLSPILTAVQLMGRRAPELFMKERGIVERQVRHMVRLVDDLLDVSRIARGRVKLQRAPVELGAVVAQALETARPLLEERAHTLVASVPGRGLVVHADTHRLAQVIVNLLANAAKFTPPGGLIEITAKRQDGTVSLRVRDTGAGIEAALLPQIFDLFAQGAQASDRAQGGLGLGLAIAKNLVELHGGALRAESDGPGRGSSFTLELAALPEPPPAPAPSAPTFAAAGRGRRVLVVDDNADAARTLGDALADAGYSVRVAHDGPAALEMVAQFLPEIALLDIGLPVMDGHELAQRLSALLGPAAPKLVAITGYGLETDRRRSSAAGFVEHMIRPVDFQKLERVMIRLLADPLR